jgi:hypothetical protein
MTNLTEVIDLMIPKIPLEMRSDEMIDIELAKVGVIDMASALSFESLNLEKSINEVFNDETGEFEEEISYSVSPALNFSQLRLAAYFAYGAYLQRLKLSYTNDAINFSTLTFAIKGLEKRPEMIGDELYRYNRYMQDEIAKANGSSAILGTARKFGD